MSGLITGGDDGTELREPACASLFVAGARYANTAAKFWPTLLDEVMQGFPTCTVLKLEATGSGPIENRHLYPELEFRRHLQQLLDSDLETEMRNALAELDIIGPPPAVRLRLLQVQEELHAAELPLDCVDAEIFTYLVAWPLKWAGIPSDCWNNEFLSGAFTAEDRIRRRVYRFSFGLRNRLLGEGLYERTISLEISPAD